MSIKEKMPFKKSDLIFCSSHGVGKVVEIEEKTILEDKIKVLNILFHASNLNILVPLNNIQSMGIRALSTKENMLNIVKNIITKQARISKSIWTKRIVESETKLYSGSPSLIAEIIRDIFPGIKDQNRSYGERVIFEKALNQFVEEYAAVFGIMAEEANMIITDALAKSYNQSTIVIEDNVNEDGDFDDLDLGNIEDVKEKNINVA